MATAVEVTQYMQAESYAKAPSTSMRMGKIVSVVATGKVTITLGGAPDTEAVPARHLGSYNPAVGDTVLVLVQEPDLLVVGSITKGQDIGTQLDPEVFSQKVDGDWTLSNGAVRNFHVLDRELAGLKLQLGTIQEDLLADNAVTETKILNDSITTPKIRALNIVGDHIQARTIVAGKVAVGTITSEEINVAQLTASQAFIDNLEVRTANILNLAVTTAKIGDLAVGTAKIGDLAITNAKIANLAVTNAKINDLSADKITAGTISAGTVNIATQLTMTTGGDISAANGRFHINAEAVEFLDDPNGVLDSDIRWLTTTNSVYATVGGTAGNVLKLYGSGGVSLMGDVTGSGVSEANDVSTLAKRNSAGDIRARLFRPEYNSLNTAANVGYFWTSRDIGTGDNYLRPTTPFEALKGLFSTNIWHESSDGSPRLYFANAGHTYIRTPASIYFRNSANSNIMYITNAGDGRIYGTWYVDGFTRADEFHGADGGPADPSFTFTNDQDCGLYRAAVNEISMTVGGTRTVNYVPGALGIFGNFSATGSKNARIRDPGDDTTDWMFAAVEFDNPGTLGTILRDIEVPASREIRVPIPAHFSRIGDSPTVLVSPSAEPTPGPAPYAFATGWNTDNPEIVVRGAQGSYNVVLLFIRTDPGVEGWNHKNDAKYRDEPVVAA